MTVLASYNVHRCVGTDGRHDPERIARVLAELSADVVALQEVDTRLTLPDGSHQLDFLAARTGLQAVPGPTILHPEGFYGNALLTRLRVVQTRRYDVSLTGREPRGFLEAVLEGSGTRLRVLAVHLGLKVGERRHQVDRLLDIVRGIDPTEVLAVLGDFNDWIPGGRLLRNLNGLLGHQPVHRTFPSRLPVFPLDRLWVRPKGLVREHAVHRTATSRVASDHLPVRVRLGVPPPRM